jgi:hypothetical protein
LSECKHVTTCTLHDAPVAPDYKRLKKLLRHLTSEEQDESTLREHERIFREALEVMRV